MRRHLQKYRDPEESNTLTSNKIKSARDSITKFIVDVEQLSKEIESIKSAKWIFIGFGCSRYSLKEVFLISYRDSDSSCKSFIQSIVEYFFQLPKPKVGSYVFLHINDYGDSEVPFKMGMNTHIYLINTREDSLPSFRFNNSKLPDYTFSKVKKLPENSIKKQNSTRKKFSAKID